MATAGPVPHVPSVGAVQRGRHTARAQTYSSSKALSAALLSASPRKAIGAPSRTLGKSAFMKVFEKFIKPKIDKFVQTSIKQLNDAPLEYAIQREGAVVDPLDFSKPDTWASNLQNRSAILTEQAKRSGIAPKGLMQQEAAMLSQFLATASDQAKTETLKMLRKGFSDDKVFRATMQQIAKDSPVTALAGMVATRERPMKISGFFSDETFTPGSTAGLMLAGERILNPSKDAKGQDGKPTFPMPKDQDIRLAFNSQAGDAFAGNPEAYQIAYQAARATYAGLVAQKGDYSGNLNDGLLREAIQRSTGGVADINGARVVKPWGMDDSTFKNVVKAEFGRQTAAAGIPQMKDQWPRLQLQNTKGGYLVKSGTGYLLGKDGNPILLRDQNRARWDRLQIRRGLNALERAQRLGGGQGPYALQAAIAACHARALRAEDTDWTRIAGLYALLARAMPSPVVELVMDTLERSYLSAEEAAGLVETHALFRHDPLDPGTTRSCSGPHDRGETPTSGSLHATLELNVLTADGLIQISGTEETGWSLETLTESVELTVWPQRPLWVLHHETHGAFVIVGGTGTYVLHVAP